MVQDCSQISCTLVRNGFNGDYDWSHWAYKVWKTKDWRPIHSKLLSILKKCFILSRLSDSAQDRRCLYIQAPFLTLEQARNIILGKYILL